MGLALYCPPPAVHWALQLAGIADYELDGPSEVVHHHQKKPLSPIYMRRRTEIWIETERAFVQTQCLSQKQWCLLCVAPSVMLTVDESATFLASDVTSIYRLIYSGAVHFTRDSSNGLLICVQTLWSSGRVDCDDAASRLTQPPRL